jgi:hypothetical protein
MMESDYWQHPWLKRDTTRRGNVTQHALIIATTETVYSSSHTMEIARSRPQLNSLKASKNSLARL